MPFSIQFNLTPDVGYMIIVELYADTLEVPPGFPADLVLGHCTSEATREVKWVKRTPIDRRRWTIFTGYDDEQLRPCLLLIFTTMLDYDRDRAENNMRDIELELAMNQVNYEAIAFDDQPT
jgi:hypothetical protein